MTFRRRRVRVHLADRPGVAFPSVEGVLIGRWREFRVSEPSLLLAPGAGRAELADAVELRIPRANVAFYEVLR